MDEIRDAATKLLAQVNDGRDPVAERKDSHEKDQDRRAVAALAVNAAIDSRPPHHAEQHVVAVAQTETNARRIFFALAQSMTEGDIALRTRLSEESKKGELACDLRGGVECGPLTGTQASTPTGNVTLPERVISFVSYPSRTKGRATHRRQKRYKRPQPTET
jgi:hypothetical protein